MISRANWNKSARENVSKTQKKMHARACRASEICLCYLLKMYKYQFMSRYSILSDKWRQQATSALLDENLTCEFKRKYSFPLSKS